MCFQKATKATLKELSHLEKVYLFLTGHSTCHLFILWLLYCICLSFPSDEQMASRVASEEFITGHSTCHLFILWLLYCICLSFPSDEQMASRVASEEFLTGHSTCHLFILWLLYCICLSFPSVLGAGCESNCIGSLVLLFTLHSIIISI